MSSNAVLQAFISAYNQPHDIVLSPDDMLMVVCMYFANYVNKNTEQLRSLFVEDQDGRIDLTVKDFQREHQWDDFFNSMKVNITENVKGDVCCVLTSDFATTGKVESILSTACIMHAFKFYVNYSRTMKFLCGIRQVYFMGKYTSHLKRAYYSRSMILILATDWSRIAVFRLEKRSHQE